jgi:hypothetical protein
LQLKVPAAASGRAINREYVSQKAEKKELTTRAKIFGAQYEIDRVLNQAQASEVAFQSEEAIKSTTNKFLNVVINGEEAANATAGDGGEFNGLSKLLTGGATEITSTVDMTVATDAALRASAIKLCEELDLIIGRINGTPDFIVSNEKGIIKLKSAARMLGYLTQVEDAFGRPVDAYNSIPFLDMKNYVKVTAADSTATPPTTEPTVSSEPIVKLTAGKTDIYVVRFGRDALHGVSINGDKMISYRLPDFTTAGAVKKGDVEFVGTIALKSTLGCGVIRGVKVAAAL